MGDNNNGAVVIIEDAHDSEDEGTLVQQTPLTTQGVQASDQPKDEGIQPKNRNQTKVNNNISNSNSNNNNNNNNKNNTEILSDDGMGEESAGSPDPSWNWLSNLKTRIESSNQHLLSKIEKSNKAIEERIQNSNKLIETKFQEGLGTIHEGIDTITSAPSRAAGSIRRKHNMRVELQEKLESEHWKHEKKLLTNFECLDYTTIYNKSYRSELYTKFFDVTGDYEWLRWILSFVIAIIIGFLAWTAKTVIKKVTEYKFEWVEEQMEKNEIVYYILAFLIYAAINVSLAVAGSLVAVIYEPTAAGSGIPEVKAYLNGTKVPSFLRMRTLWAKLISMILANAAGLQVGAEGPMIHIGALVGNGVSQAQSKELGFQIPFIKHFRNDRDKRDFITSGAGAGVAAAFGAPLGGTLFSLEEVSSFWSTMLTWRTFFTCMVAVLMSQLMLEVQSGVYKNNGLMIFNVGFRELTYRPIYIELIPFLVIGVVGGLLGAAFTSFNLGVSKFRIAKINVKPKFRVLEVAIIALVSSSLQYMLPFAFGCKDLPPSCLASGSESTEFECETLRRHFCPEGQYNDLASIIFNSNEDTIINLFKMNYPNLLSILPIVIFFIFYIFGAAYTAGCGISSGMFVPMVVIGAAYGRFIGLILMYIYGSEFNDPGIFAIMGTAAFMAGVSRLTVSLTVIIIEITNDLANLLPIMLVIMTAKLVADLINHPLFDSQIEMKHIPYLEPTPVKEMKILMCKHIMAKRVKYLAEKDTIEHILMLLKNTRHNGFPVVNNRNDKLVKGIILRPQLLVVMEKLSTIWASQLDREYSHQEYQTKLAWNLPQLSDILNSFTEEDYNTVIDLTPLSEEFAVSEAYTMFRTMGLRHLVVVNEMNRLKGMITKKDLLEHSCKEKYKELKRLKKMNIDLPMGQELETVPGTPAEEGQPFSIRETLRRHLSSSALLSSSSSFLIRNARAPSSAQSPRVEYAIDENVVG